MHENRIKPTPHHARGQWVQSALVSDSEPCLLSLCQLTPGGWLWCWFILGCLQLLSMRAVLIIMVWGGLQS